MMFRRPLSRKRGWSLGYWVMGRSEGGSRTLRRRVTLICAGCAGEADGTTRSDNADRGEHGLLGADALEDGVDAEAARQLAHARHPLLATLAHDVRCAKLFRQRDPVPMAAENEDLLGAQASCGD